MKKHSNTYNNHCEMLELCKTDHQFDLYFSAIIECIKKQWLTDEEADELWKRGAARRYAGA